MPLKRDSGNGWVGFGPPGPSQWDWNLELGKGAEAN